MTDHLLATVTITKTLTDDDVIIDITACDPEGDTMPLVDALGMIELGKDSLIRSSMGEDH
jgi:hypothetical protein